MNASPLIDTYEQLPFTVSKGEGVWIYDNAGTPYLDLYGGHAVALLGHSPKRLTDAISEQAKTLLFYSNIAPLKIRETAGEKLASLVWDGFRHIFFCNSGAEANDNALKLSLRMTGRTKLAAFKGSFHGRSFLTTAVTDSPATHTELSGWLEGKVSFLQPNTLQDLSFITHETAAVILEPIQSIGGVVSFTKEYLSALRSRCTETGTFLIFDEVQTGMCRTGNPFISGYCGVSPDMFTTAKGIASGYPIGALFVSDEITQSIKPGDLGSTYGGGPVAMAAVAATVDIIHDEKIPAHVEMLDAEIRSLQNEPFVEEIRGKGCLIGIKTTKPAKDLVRLLLEKRIVTGTCKDPHVLRLLPPVVITKEHITLLKNALMEIFV